MEVKPGYKQTDMGILPEDWEVKPLGKLASVTAGGTPSRKNPQYWNGSIPWVTTSEVNFYNINHAEQFITKDGLNNSAAKLLPSGTLLMALYGQGKTRGKVGILGIEAATNQACAAISLKQKVSREFIFHFLASRYDAIRNLSNSGSQENLNGSLVRSISIPLPLEAEQRAVAAALSDVDALLGALDRLIAKKRDLKQAAMQQLLTGQTRLPGFHGEWETIRFADLADKTRPWSIVGGPFGSNLKASDYTAEGVRIIQLQNIGDGRFLDDYAIYTSDAKADELLSNNIYPGEIILSKMGYPVARACLMPSNDRRYLMASDGIRLVVDPKQFDTRFVLEYINAPYFRGNAVEASTGSTRQRIGMEDLKSLPFVRPSLPEQTAIAAVLTDMDTELATLEQRLTKTRALKQGMMQELLTGKTRLV